MSLGRMKALFCTVDDQWRSPIAEEVLSHWEHEPGSARAINASSNFVFGFRSSGEQRILRFVVDEPGPFQRHSLEAIQAELDFIRYLGERGVHAAQPIASLAGKWVETTDTEVGRVHASVFEHMSGVSFELEELPLERYPDWGRAIAELHNATQGYHRPGRPGWREHLEGAERALPHDDATARAALKKLRQALEALPASEANFSLIHWDLTPDNIFWKDGEPGYIDFDDASYDWFAADLAYAVRSLFEDRASRFDPEHPGFQAILAGYRARRPLADEEVANLPLFLVMSHVLNYAELLTIVDGEKETNEPEWTQDLRKKLASYIDSYRMELQAFTQIDPCGGEIS